MDGKACYFDNIFEERLQPAVEYEEVYLKACANVLKDQSGLETTSRLCNDPKLHSSGVPDPGRSFSWGAGCCSRGL